MSLQTINLFHIKDKCNILHFHYVLSMGAVFALFSAWYFWIPKILGLSYDITLGKVHFWILFIGVVFHFYLNVFNIKTFKLKIKGRNFIPNYVAGLKYSGLNNRKSPNNFVLYFKDVKNSKSNIYSELRKKSGVYLFINNITNDLYVGSSLNLTRRMAIYFYLFNSNKISKSVVIRAMKKYGLENFSLAILDFCEKDSLSCLNLEQKWIDTYNPSYNVLKVAGSSSGFKHKISTILKLKELFKKENHPKYGSISSNETKKAISDGIKNFYLSNTHASKGLKGKLSPQYGIGGKYVFCYDKDNKELIFPSINAARQHFKVRWTYIKNNLDTKNTIELNEQDWIIQSIPRN